MSLSIPEFIRVLLPDGKVKRLDLEEYVRGVVAAALPPDAPLEALKAQAVAARTFGLVTQRHGERGQVCTLRHCQVWQAAASPRVARAARETRGIVAVNDGQLIEAFYFDHCDGRTRDAAGILRPAPPYLTAVACPCGFAALKGHGIGMCQSGAMVMARFGDSFDFILKHYYSGITLERVGAVPSPSDSPLLRLPEEGPGVGDAAEPTAPTAEPRSKSPAVGRTPHARPSTRPAPAAPQPPPASEAPPGTTAVEPTEVDKQAHAPTTLAELASTPPTEMVRTDAVPAAFVEAQPPTVPPATLGAESAAPQPIAEETDWYPVVEEIAGSESEDLQAVEEAPAALEALEIVPASAGTPVGGTPTASPEIASEAGDLLAELTESALVQPLIQALPEALVEAPPPDSLPEPLPVFDFDLPPLVEQEIAAAVPPPPLVEEKTTAAAPSAVLVDHLPGPRVIAGDLARPGIVVTIRDIDGHAVVTVSGTARHYGAGGFEAPVDDDGLYAVSFDHHALQVELKDETVFICATEGSLASAA